MYGAPDPLGQIAASGWRSERAHRSVEAQSSHRPLIGIPTSQIRNQRGSWLMEAADAACIRALQDAGADPVLFPCRPLHASEDPFEVVWRLLRRCDGLLLPGGALDCVPGWYREASLPLSKGASGSWWWEDWWKFHLAQLATLIGLPFLGICQGLQYWVVANGGQLYQDIRAQYPRAAKHARGSTETRWQFNLIRLCGEPGSILSHCAEQAQAIWGPCMHHQAVRSVPEGLLVTALELDGLVAGLERSDGFFGLGVQWHPEQREIYATQPYSRRIFARFVAEAQTSVFSQHAEADDLFASCRAYLARQEHPEEQETGPLPRLLAETSPHLPPDVPAKQRFPARALRQRLRKDPASQVLFS